MQPYLAVRAGTRVFYVDRHPGPERISIDIELGQPLFLHSTAVGKLFAAYDDVIREVMLSSPMPRLTARTLTGLGACSGSSPGFDGRA